MIKKFRKTLFLPLLLVLFLAGATYVYVYAAGPTTVNLGTADNFAILAGSGITNVPTSTIVGDAGSHPTPSNGLTNAEVTGTNYTASSPVVEQAKVDLVTAYNDAAGRTPVSTVPTELGGTTKTTGVYNSADGTFGITGTLTLDAQGDPTAVFIFKTASTLITAGASNMVLTGDAQACNVFWQVGSSATLDTSSNFKGNILALTSITDNGGSTIDGRLLARNGAVTLNQTHVTKQTCATPPEPTPSATLTLVKTVINNSGGTKTVSDFPLFVGTTSVASGVATTFAPGTYTASETNSAGYTASVWGGDCAGAGSVTLADGDNKTCTITNDDIAPIPTLPDTGSGSADESNVPWNIIIITIVTFVSLSLLYATRRKQTN
ncbi:MAG: ice-binding family protein [Candidatus Spechtbacterales bacterium]